MSPARSRRGAQVVGLGGLEPPTSRLSGARSSQLSYRPKAVLALHEGRETLSKTTSRTALHLEKNESSAQLPEASGGARPFKTKQQAQSVRRNLDCGADLVDLCSAEALWHRLCPASPKRGGSTRWPGLLRKEVIQPQVPLRLPCYDFTPVTNHSLGTSW